MSNNKKESTKADFLAFICIIAALIVFLSLISFHPSSHRYFSRSPRPAANLIGIAGHATAGFLYYILGLGAFFFPSVLIFCSIILFKNKNLKTQISSIIYIFFLTFFITVFLNNYFSFPHFLAGLYPHFFHNILLYFGMIGRFIVELVFIFAVCLFLFQLESLKIFKLLYAYTGKFLNIFKNKIKNMSLQKNNTNDQDILIRGIEESDNIKSDNKSNFFEKKKIIINVFSQKTDKSLVTKVIKNKPESETNENQSYSPKNDNKIDSVKEYFNKKDPAEPTIRDYVIKPGDDYTESSTAAVSSQNVNSNSEIQSQAPLPVKSAADDKLNEEIIKKFGVDDKRPSVLNSQHDRYAPAGELFINDINLIDCSINVNYENVNQVIQETATKLENTIKDFGIEAKVVEVSRGPVITRFELTVETGIKISKIVGLSDNIALALAAPSVRIVAPIPGKSVIGIEIPNKNREMVKLRDILDTDVFKNAKSPLPVALGKSIEGKPVIYDLAQAPHLLIAGATGAGKSVCVNSIIASLLFMASPAKTRLMLIDPKMVELKIYNDIPHLITPVVTDAKKASLALRWLIAEMESRYYLLEKFGVRSIGSYNDELQKKIKNKEPLEEGLGTLPYIVVVIDEFADLMMIAQKEVEDSVSRLAAMSRAVGIHLILATQRPSVDVITGVIKANFPTRIAFQVASKIDSRTIIDINGAEKLLGKGDMLFQKPTASMPERIQGTFLSDKEVRQIVQHLINKQGPQYIPDVFEIGKNTDKNNIDEIEDSLFNEAIEIVIRDKKASASYLQRKLKIGYNRAARIVELMEEHDIVGPAQGSKPREVLISEWN